MKREQIIEILKEYEFINPTHISDGYGEFPDTYKMKESDAVKLTELISLTQQDEPSVSAEERFYFYKLGAVDEANEKYDCMNPYGSFRRHMNKKFPPKTEK